MKELSRKQVIVSMSSKNTKRVITKLNTHIMNINSLLKDIKSDISAYFICSNNKDIVITTNKIAAVLDLKIMEKYIKEVNDVNVSNIMSPRLS